MSNDTNARKYPEFKPTIFDLPQLKLYTKIPNSDRKGCLAVSIVNGMPRFTVYTNVEGDSGGGKAWARLGPLDFTAFLQRGQHILDNPEYMADTEREGMYSKNFPRLDDGSVGKELKVESLIQFGRDEKGWIYVSLTNKQITPLKFYFLPTDYHYWVRNGKPIDEKEVTQIYCESWCKLLFQLYCNFATKDFTPPPPRVDYKNNNATNGYKKPYVKPDAAPKETVAPSDDWTSADFEG